MQPGWRTVDIGCGPIGILDLLAERVGADGTVLGIEREPRFADMARNLIAERRSRHAPRVVAVLLLAPALTCATATAPELRFRVGGRVTVSASRQCCAVSPRFIRKSFHGYRLIDLPTGDVLASIEDDVGWTSFLRSQVRTVLEREGRERAATLAVVDGDVFEDDGSPVHQPTTGDELVVYAFDEPWPNPHEPPVGLDPQAFTDEWWDEFPEVKMEYWDGVLCGSRPLRATLLRALLVNMGLREVVRFAPRDLWLQALGTQEPQQSILALSTTAPSRRRQPRHVRREGA